MSSHRTPSVFYRVPEQTTRHYHGKCTLSNPAFIGPRMATINSSVVVTYEQSQKESTVVKDEVWRSSCCKERCQQIKWYVFIVTTHDLVRIIWIKLMDIRMKF